MTRALARRAADHQESYHLSLEVYQRMIMARRHALSVAFGFHLAAGVSLLIAACSPEPAAQPATVSQTAHALPRTPNVVADCASCKLNVAVRFIIESPASATGGPFIWSQLSLGGDGRFYLAPTAEPGTVEVYDSIGERVLSFGQAGSGPGELRAVVGATATDSGTIAVVEGGRREPVRYFTSGGEFISNAGHPVSIRRVQWTPAGVLLTSATQSQDQLIPVHLLGGNTLTGIGEFSAEDRRSIIRWQDAEVAFLNGEIWVARADRFDISAYSTGGERSQHHVRDEQHFRDEPAARVFGVTTLDDYLVLLTHIRNPGYSVPADWDPRRPLSTELIDEKLDTRIDVIDPQTGEYVASGIMDYGVAGVAGPGLIYMPREQSDGTMSMYVWHITMAH